MAAVCPECNVSKSNVPFAVWVHSDYAKAHGITMNDVIARVNQLMFPPSMNRKQVGQVKKSIISRLKQTEQDEPLDNRSIESVGWMADELHRRLDGRYANKQVKVFTFPGSITYEARRLPASMVKSISSAHSGRPDSTADIMRLTLRSSP